MSHLPVEIGPAPRLTFAMIMHGAAGGLGGRGGGDGGGGMHTTLGTSRVHALPGSSRLLLLVPSPASDVLPQATMFPVKVLGALGE